MKNFYQIRFECVHCRRWLILNLRQHSLIESFECQCGHRTTALALSRFSRKSGKPYARAIAASLLVVSTMADRVPEFREQTSPSAQAPARRHDDQDDIHYETDAEAVAVVQAVLQAPPPAPAMPPGQQLIDGPLFRRDDDASWYGAMAAMDTPRNAALYAPVAETIPAIVRRPRLLSYTNRQGYRYPTTWGVPGRHGLRLLFAWQRRLTHQPTGDKQ